MLSPRSTATDAPGMCWRANSDSTNRLTESAGKPPPFCAAPCSAAPTRSSIAVATTTGMGCMVSGPPRRRRQRLDQLVPVPRCVVIRLDAHPLVAPMGSDVVHPLEEGTDTLGGDPAISRV